MSMDSLDPITAEVVLNRLRETTEAMAHALFHSGYSPILRESQDGTAGLTDAAGRVIMVGGGLQYHSLLYSKAVGSFLDRYPADVMRDGDAFVSNDPYKAGNSHMPDMVVASPVFHDGVIIAFGVSVAHKADVGGLAPGSSGATARSIFHDGLLLPPVRIWSRDGVNLEIEAVIRNNSRAPDVVMGDLRGQIGATRLGAERLGALCDEYGVGALSQAWPDGSHEAEGLLDHDGADKSRPVRIHVRAVKQGDRLTLYFSGSEPQTSGPVNAPESTARRGAVGSGDGAAMVLPMNHFAPGTPVEVVETEYPVRVQRFDLWRDSAGAGENRGGAGFRRDYRFLTDCTLTARTSNHQYPAWGLFGGRSPPTSSTTLTHEDGAVEEMDVMETRQVGAGVTISLAQSGGGGYGDPKSRPPEKVALDVADGYVGRDAAAEIYGVVIGEDGAVDEAATSRLRIPLSGT